MQWIKLEIVQNFGFHPKLWFSPKKLCHAVFCQCVLLWLTIEDSGKIRNFHSASCQGWFEIYSNPIKLKVNNSGEFSYSQTQIHLIHLNSFEFSEKSKYSLCIWSISLSRVDSSLNLIPANHNLIKIQSTAYNALISCCLINCYYL